MDQDARRQGTQSLKSARWIMEYETNTHLAKTQREKERKGAFLASTASTGMVVAVCIV